MVVSKTRAQIRVRNGSFLGALVALLLAGTPAVAVPITFTCLTNNTPECVALASQIDVEATNPGSNRLQLVFSNPGPIASSITDIYFDFAGSLFSGIFSSFGSAGVSFPIDGATPGNLPAGMTAVPAFVSNLSIDSANPPPQNGIEPPLESLTLLLNIGGGNDIGDVVDQFVSGDFRIGLHVQAIGTSGGSDSFISNPLPTGTPRDLSDAVIPEPSRWLLMSAGVVGLIARRRFIS
jgi:hypothetical protein